MCQQPPNNNLGAIAGQRNHLAPVQRRDLSRVIIFWRARRSLVGERVKRARISK